MPYLYYCLYRRLSAHVYSGTKKFVICLTYTTAYIDASLFMSIVDRKNVIRFTCTTAYIDASLFMSIVDRKKSHTPHLYYFLYRRLSVHVYSGGKK
jgi:hypothetical protein